MSDWICPTCGADVDDGFDVCWQCGTASDGTVASGFVPEVDVATLPPNFVQTVHCDACGYEGKILVARHQYGVWAFILTPILVLSFWGLIPLFYWLRLTEAVRVKMCPRCRSGDQIHDWYGDVAPDNETLRAEAQANETRQFQRSRLQLLCVILGTLLVPGAMMLAAWLVNR